VQQYNCAGCHVIENQGGYIRSLYEENPTLAPPSLNGEGGKVHETDRVVRVSDGEVYEVRGVMPIPGNRPKYYELYSTVRRDKVAAS